MEAELRNWGLTSFLFPIPWRFHSAAWCSLKAGKGAGTPSSGSIHRHNPLWIHMDPGNVGRPLALLPCWRLIPSPFQTLHAMLGIFPTWKSLKRYRDCTWGLLCAGALGFIIKPLKIEFLGVFIYSPSSVPVFTGVEWKKKKKGIIQEWSHWKCPKSKSFLVCSELFGRRSEQQEIIPREFPGVLPS